MEFFNSIIEKRRRRGENIEKLCPICHINLKWKTTTTTTRTARARATAKGDTNSFLQLNGIFELVHFGFGLICTMKYSDVE